jgi:hypothetical protein
MRQLHNYIKITITARGYYYYDPADLTSFERILFVNGFIESDRATREGYDIFLLREHSDNIYFACDSQYVKVVRGFDINVCSITPVIIVTKTRIDIPINYTTHLICCILCGAMIEHKRSYTYIVPCDNFPYPKCYCSRQVDLDKDFDNNLNRSDFVLGFIAI